MLGDESSFSSGFLDKAELNSESVQTKLKPLRYNLSIICVALSNHSLLGTVCTFAMKLGFPVIRNAMQHKLKTGTIAEFRFSLCE